MMRKHKWDANAETDFASKLNSSSDFALGPDNRVLPEGYTGGRRGKTSVSPRGRF